MNKIYLSILAVVLPAHLIHLDAAEFREASLTKVIRDVRVGHAGAGMAPAQMNQRITGESVVATGTKSRAELMFTDKTLTRLGSNTIFSFQEGTRNMNLDRGTLLLRVPKNAGGARISTAAVTAAITGTTVMVEYNPADGSASPSRTVAADRATLLRVSGRVEYAAPGSNQFRPASAGQTFQPGTTVRTVGDSRALLAPLRGSAVALQRDTVLRIVGLAPATSTRQAKVRLQLDTGNVFTAIAPKSAKSMDFKIRTPTGVAAARGTFFVLAVKGQTAQLLGLDGTTNFLMFSGGNQNVGPGYVVSMNGNQFGGIQKVTPQFLAAVMPGVLDLLRTSIQSGAIAPRLAQQIVQGLQKSGAPLSPQDRQSLRDASRQAPPPSTNTGGGNKKGFTKFMVLEGEMRLFIPGQTGESTLLKAGEMVVMQANSRRLPRKIMFDLRHTLKTAGLINDQQFEEMGSENLITQAVTKQDRKLTKKQLWKTNLLLTENSLTTEEIQNAIITQQLQDKKKAIVSTIAATKKPDDPFSAIPTIAVPNTFPINNTTTITTNPTITTASVGDLLFYGRFWNFDVNGDFADFFFGNRKNVFDLLLEYNDVFSPETEGGGTVVEESIAGFKFANLEISDSPDIQVNGAYYLALISMGALTLDGTTSIDLSGPDALVLIGNNVNLSGPEELNTPSMLAIIAREGNMLINTDITGADSVRLASNGNMTLNGSFTDVYDVAMLVNGTLTFGTNTFDGYQISSFDAVAQTVQLTGDIDYYNSLPDPESFYYDDGSYLSVGGGGIQASDGEGGFYDLMNFAAISSLGDINVGNLKAYDILAAKAINADTITTKYLQAGTINAMTLKTEFISRLPVDPVGGYNFNVNYIEANGGTNYPNVVTFNFGGDFDYAGIESPGPIISSPGEGRDGGPDLLPDLKDGAAPQLNGADVTLNVTENTGAVDEYGYPVATGSVTFGDNYNEIGGVDVGAYEAGTNGGNFTVNADNDITVKSNIYATNGMGGDGGTVTLNADGKIEMYNDSEGISTIHASNDYSANGGEVRMTSQANTGVGIDIQNSSEIFALMDTAANAKGGKIILKTPNGAGILVDGRLEANDIGGGGFVASTPSEIIIEQMGTSASPVELMEGATLNADVIKASALGANGNLYIHEGANISADSMIGLYGNSSNGTVHFKYNGSNGGFIDLNSPLVEVGAHTVTVDNSLTVQNQGGDGTINVNATQHNYNTTGYGNITNANPGP